MSATAAVVPVQTTVIRPSNSSDLRAVKTFVAQLSEETAYRRFLAPVPRLTAAHAAAMVCVDHFRDETLLAEVTSHGARCLAGVAQYVGLSPTSAEMAIVVADEWQRQGIGTALLRRLATLAAQRHYLVLSGDYLSENRAIVRLAQRMPGELTLHRDGPTSVMTLNLPPPRYVLPMTPLAA